MGKGVKEGKGRSRGDFAIDRPEEGKGWEDGEESQEKEEGEVRKGVVNMNRKTKGSTTN